MSEAHNSRESDADLQSSSFVHAFLPGLILGLVAGGLAGAFLPGWINSGPRIPEPSHSADGPRPHDEERAPPNPEGGVPDPTQQTPPDDDADEDETSQPTPPGQTP